MANIDQFYLGPDLYDLGRLTLDLAGKMFADHGGEENAVRLSELCHYYFDPYPIDIEEEFLIQHILQRARAEMERHSWLLDYRRRSGWFIAQTGAEAYSHSIRYAKRLIESHRRLETKAHILTGERYQLPPGDSFIQAIHGMTPAIEQLEEAVNNPEPPAPPQLEEGQENENEDKN